MNLYLLRHGVAADRDSHRFARDADRPLTAEGERKIRQVAKALDRLGVSVDFVYSSPYVRARQTAEIVAEVLSATRRLVLSRTLTPNGSFHELITEIRSKGGEDVLLVGHEPHLSSLISLLVSGRSDLSVTLKKGGLCKLSLGKPRHGRCASLEWLLTSKHLRFMAQSH